MSLITIKVNPEYSKLVPRMTGSDYEIFKQSIKDEGLNEPLTVSDDYTLVDGHNRLQACNELGIEIPEEKIRVKHFDDPLSQKRWVITINLRRRNLKPFQLVEMAYELEKIEAEKAKLRMKAGKKLETLGSNDHRGRARDVAAELVGIPSKTLDRGKTIIKYATEEVKQRLREGKTEIGYEFRVIDRKKKIEKIKAEAAAIQLPEGIKLYHGNMLDVCAKHIPDSSIPLLFTDAPYALKHLDLYRQLAGVAYRVLQDGGSLVVYPNYGLDETITIMKQAGLKCWWHICVELSGQHQQLYDKGVFVDCKPLLWFVKGDKRAEPKIFFSDFVKSEKPDKSLHSQAWEQSPVEAEHVINALTVEGQIVLDPFMGSGTTGIAALKLKRQFIGIEIDKNECEIAEAKIKKFTRGDV